MNTNAWIEHVRQFILRSHGQLFDFTVLTSIVIVIQSDIDSRKNDIETDADFRMAECADEDHESDRSAIDDYSPD